MANLQAIDLRLREPQSVRHVPGPYRAESLSNFSLKIAPQPANNPLSSVVKPDLW